MKRERTAQAGGCAGKEALNLKPAFRHGPKDVRGSSNIQIHGNKHVANMAIFSL